MGQIKQITQRIHVLDDEMKGVKNNDIISGGKRSKFDNLGQTSWNSYNTLHGGVVGSIAETVAIACDRTDVNQDEELFLGDLSVSYLAAAVCPGRLSTRWEYGFHVRFLPLKISLCL